MGYLARRKNTYFIRLLLLPSVLVVTIRGTFGYGDLNNEFPFYVWLRSNWSVDTRWCLRINVSYSRSLWAHNRSNDVGFCFFAGREA